VSRSSRYSGHDGRVRCIYYLLLLDTTVVSLTTSFYTGVIPPLLTGAVQPTAVLPRCPVSERLAKYVSK